MPCATPDHEEDDDAPTPYDPPARAGPGPCWRCPARRRPARRTSWWPAMPCVIGLPSGLTSTLVEYRRGRQTESSTLAIYSKADPAGGRSPSLVRYTAGRDANKLILFSSRTCGSTIRPARPASSVAPAAPARAGLQRRRGDGHFARDYQAVAAVERTQDGDRQTRRCRSSTCLRPTRTPPTTASTCGCVWPTPVRSRPASAPRRQAAEDRLLPPLPAHLAPVCSGPPR